MFTTTKRELKELIQLTHNIAAGDAALCANRKLIPEDSYWQKRSVDDARRIFLLQKYELL
jgi:hypothetical protein